MSYLSGVRIYFAGKYTANAATGNNQPNLLIDGQQPQKIFDFANVSVKDDIQIDGKTATDVELRQWLTLEANVGAYVRNWNYYGGNICAFDTQVSGVDLGQGYSTGDALVGTPTGFFHTAMSDVNPCGTQSTQLFFDTFQLNQTQLPDGTGDSNWPWHTFSRWVWFDRNISPQVVAQAQASGVFETVVPMAENDWQTLLAANPNSQAVKALYESALQTKAVGLNVRMCMYLTDFPPDKPTEPQSYRVKYGKVTGVIGLLQPGEMYNYPVLGAASRRLKGVSLPFPPKYPADAPAQLGPVIIAVDTAKRVITLDMVTAIPEDGAQAVKVNLGPLVLKLGDGQDAVTVATLPYEAYNADAYVKTSGLIDIPYDDKVAAMLSSCGFSIVRSCDSSVLYSEIPVVETDQRGSYLNVGQSGSITVKASCLGIPMAGATIYLQQEVTTDNDEGGPPAATPDQYLATMPDSVVTGVDGTATIPLTATRAGNFSIRFSVTKPPAPNPNVAMLDTLNDGFANVRVLPVDDYSGITDEQLLGQAGFQLIYDKILRYYYLTYPVMQGMVDFSNFKMLSDPTVMEEIKTVTSADIWGGYAYMPRTRDLTDARRALLWRWADVNIAAAAKAAAGK